MLIPLTLLGALVAALAPVKGNRADTATAFALVLAFVVLPGYLGLMQGGKRGQTVGKRATGVAVRRAETFEAIGYPRSFARASLIMAFPLVPALSTLATLAAVVVGWLALLDGLWPLWDKRNQSLHDKIAKTVVINDVS
jgi:uncharacterized RDD family membrane protein YckC